MGDTVVVLSESAPLPFPVDSGDDTDINEEVRLRYRYLDLRREKPAHNLRLRSKVTSTIRRVMEEETFLEIETPYLTRSTPEGARDFLVPVRLQPGSWYALPQSPQLFKQLLMVAGMAYTIWSTMFLLNVAKENCSCSFFAPACPIRVRISGLFTKTPNFCAAIVASLIGTKKPVTQSSICS